jgi:hypothetical protein
MNSILKRKSLNLQKISLQNKILDVGKSLKETLNDEKCPKRHSIFIHIQAKHK